jgi:phage tail-like protein
MSFRGVARELFKPAEPEINYNFVVFLGAAMFGNFKSVSGFSYTTPKSEIAVGGHRTKRNLPFKPGDAGSWGHVTLKWGTSSLTTLNAWANAVKVGSFFRREVFILQMNRSWQPTRIFYLHGAWPVKWTADDFDGDSGTSPWTVTSVELAYESMHMMVTRLDLLRGAGLNIGTQGIDPIFPENWDFGEESGSEDTAAGLTPDLQQAVAADPSPVADRVPRMAQAVAGDRADVFQQAVTIAQLKGALARLEERHDLAALGTLDASELTADQLAAVTEAERLEQAVESREAQLRTDLTEKKEEAQEALDAMSENPLVTKLRASKIEELDVAELEVLLAYNDAESAVDELTAQLNDLPEPAAQ